MDNPVTRISVRNLVEFILQSGDLDNRRGTIDKDAMLKGSRLHRKLQKQMGGDYRAEVALRMNCSYEDLDIRLEGRADGIFTEDEVVWIDEIKGIYGNKYLAQSKDSTWSLIDEKGNTVTKFKKNIKICMVVKMSYMVI